MHAQQKALPPAHEPGRVAVSTEAREIWGAPQKKDNETQGDSCCRLIQKVSFKLPTSRSGTTLSDTKDKRPLECNLCYYFDVLDAILHLKVCFRTYWTDHLWKKIKKG